MVRPGRPVARGGGLPAVERPPSAPDDPVPARPRDHRLTERQPAQLSPRLPRGDGRRHGAPTEHRHIEAKATVPIIHRIRRSADRYVRLPVGFGHADGADDVAEQVAAGTRSEGGLVTISTVRSTVINPGRWWSVDVELTQATSSTVDGAGKVVEDFPVVKAYTMNLAVVYEAEHWVVREPSDRIGALRALVGNIRTPTSPVPETQFVATSWVRVPRRLGRCRLLVGSGQG